MKKLTVALAAFLATFSSPALAKEPEKLTENMLYLTADENLLIMSATDVVVEGDKRLVWVMLFPKQPFISEGHAFEWVWALEEIDCKESTQRIVRGEGVGETSTVLPGSDLGKSRAETPQFILEQYVCKNNFDPRTMIGLETATMLMAKYRAAE